MRFRFLELPGELNLSELEVSSDQNGLSQTTLALGSTVGHFRLRADAIDATSTAVWTITVEP